MGTAREESGSGLVLQNNRVWVSFAAQETSWLDLTTLELPLIAVGVDHSYSLLVLNDMNEPPDLPLDPSRPAQPGGFNDDPPSQHQPRQHHHSNVVTANGRPRSSDDIMQDSQDPSQRGDSASSGSASHSKRDEPVSCIMDDQRDEEQAAKGEDQSVASQGKEVRMSPAHALTRPRVVPPASASSSFSSSMLRSASNPLPVIPTVVVVEENGEEVLTATVVDAGRQTSNDRGPGSAATDETTHKGWLPPWKGHGGAAPTSVNDLSTVHLAGDAESVLRRCDPTLSSVHSARTQPLGSGGETLNPPPAKLKRGPVRKIKSLGDLLGRGHPNTLDRQAHPNVPLPNHPFIDSHPHSRQDSHVESVFGGFHQGPTSSHLEKADSGTSTLKKGSIDSAARQQLTAGNSPAPSERPSLLSAASASTISTVRPRLITRRSSSLDLNFARRASSSTTLKEDGSRAAHDGAGHNDTSQPLQSHPHHSTNRNVSSSTAPPVLVAEGVASPTFPTSTDPLLSEKSAAADTRKRKTSTGFGSFLPNFLRSSRNRAPSHGTATPPPTLKDTVTTLPLTEAQPPTLNEKEKEVVVLQDVSADSTSSSAPHGSPSNQPELANPTSTAEVTKLAPPNTKASTNKRYSLIPSFFRSQSSSSRTSLPTAVSTPSVDEDTVRQEGPPLDEPTSSLPLPKEIGQSLPQLPSLDKNLGDITFTSLFNFDKGSPRRPTNNGSGSSSPARFTPVGGRSRASTRSSVNSFSLPFKSPLHGSGSSNRSPAAQDAPPFADQDYVNYKRSSVTSLSGLLSSSRPQRTNTTDLNMHATGSPVRPKSPAIEGILNGVRKTRLHRSNSASSVEPNRLRSAFSTSGTDLHSLINAGRSSSPQFLKNRSRSSSTVTTQSLQRSIRDLQPATLSPAITVTSSHQAPFFSAGSFPMAHAIDGLPRHDTIMDSPIDEFGNFDFELPTTAGSSSRGSYLSSSLSAINSRGRPIETRPRASTDTTSDLTTPSTPAVRFSTDSRSSSVGQSHTSSLIDLQLPSRQTSSAIPNASSPGNGSSPSAAAAILHKKRNRRRAHTAGSMLSSSVHAGATSPSNGLSAVGSTGLNGASSATNSARRSNSSSRLSNFFTSPTSFLSSSPVSSSPFLSGGSRPPSADGQMRSPRRPSSLVGSPNLSVAGANGDAWSSSSSLAFSQSNMSSSHMVSLNTSSANLSSLPVDDNVLAEPLAEGGSPLGSQTSLSTSPVASTGQRRTRSHSLLSAAANPNKSRLSVNIEEDDTPESYVERLTESVSKSEIATMLSSVYVQSDRLLLDFRRLIRSPIHSGDAFHASALTAYMAGYDFYNDPIDIALRKLLLGSHLPRETQQIDRVMEAFAERYNSCNQGLFSSPGELGMSLFC